MGCDLGEKTGGEMMVIHPSMIRRTQNANDFNSQVSKSEAINYDTWKIMENPMN